MFITTRLFPTGPLRGSRWHKVLERDVLVYRHGWVIILSGFFEPIFYLLGIGFGLGFSVQLKDWGPKGHVGEYGWGGAASTHFWISPKDDLVVVALSQFMPFSARLQNAVKPLVYEAIVD